jgi:hypothetical protein
VPEVRRYRSWTWGGKRAHSRPLFWSMTTDPREWIG